MIYKHTMQCIKYSIIGCFIGLLAGILVGWTINMFVNPDAMKVIFNGGGCNGDEYNRYKVIMGLSPLLMASVGIIIANLYLIFLTKIHGEFNG